MKKSFVMAAATVFAAGTMVASIASAQTPVSPSFGNDSLACKGVNACKGTSDCKTAKNDCKGMNDCKGHGFKKMSAQACTKANGSLTAPA